MCCGIIVLVVLCNVSHIRLLHHASHTKSVEHTNGLSYLCDMSLIGAFCTIYKEHITTIEIEHLISVKAYITTYIKVIILMCQNTSIEL